MSRFLSYSSRRGFLGALTGGVALSAAYYTTPGLFAEELALVRTPPQTEGPFYPNKLPLPVDPFTGKAFHYEVDGPTAIIKGSPPKGEETNAAFNVCYIVTIKK